MRLMWVVATVLIATSVGGCKTTDQLSMVFASEEEKAQKQTLQNVDEKIAEGDVYAAFTASRHLLQKTQDEDAVKAREKLAAVPDVETHIATGITDAIEAVEQSREFRNILKSIDVATDADLMTVERATALRQLCAETLITGIESESISLSPFARLRGLPAETKARIEEIIYAQRLKRFRQDRAWAQDHVGEFIDEASEAGPASQRAKDLRSLLGGLSVRRAQLETLRIIYPDYAERLLKETGLTLAIEAANRESEVVAFELADHLRGTLDGVTFVEDPEAADLVVILDRLTWNVRELPERSETVRYPRYEVSMFQAVMLMPDNSSYVYDVVRGGAEIRYAVSLKAREGETVVAERMVRDSDERRWQTCQNQRIVNVFGGAQRADFVANDDMRRRCSHSSGRVDPHELEQDAIERLAVEIRSLDDVKAADEKIALPPVPTAGS